MIDLLDGFQGAASIENSLYREGIPSAEGRAATPLNNQDGIRMAESNTILTHTSPLECDIPGPSHEYVATVPGSKDILSSPLNATYTPPTYELRTPQKIEDGILDSASTAFTCTNSTSAAVPRVRRLNLKGLQVATQQMHSSHRAQILFEGVKKSKNILHRQQVRKHKQLSDVKFNHLLSALMQNLKNVNGIERKCILAKNRNKKLIPRGRKFSLEEKIFALSIYKQCGKSYRYLSDAFGLPSRKTLVKVLQHIPFHTGINNRLFQHLKVRVSKLTLLDRHCVLMFDEIALQPGLQYNYILDCVDGFVDLGGADRRPKFADHALVFLLKGIRKQWKQPICFTFCEGTTQTADLIDLIKSVVRKVRETGLSIVATVSDQGATNAAAIRSLIQDTQRQCVRKGVDNGYQGYLVDEMEIVHLFDIPHLFRGIRNGLLKDDLHFVEDGVSKVGSWDHLVKLYQIERNRGHYSLIYKLTDEHVLASKLKKMSVKHCTEVFSRTVACAMQFRAVASTGLNQSSDHYLDPKATDTAHLFLFLDELFDSLNGSQIPVYPRKPLRGVVTRKSRHVSFWVSVALPLLKSMSFSNSTVTPSIKNLVFTLRGFLYIWNHLRGKNFRYFNPRSFHKSPLEYLFSCIRSHDATNTRPNCSEFMSSAKSLLINGFVSSHCLGDNCEPDDSVRVLANFKSFVETRSVPLSTEHFQVPIATYSTPEALVCNNPLDFATPYLAGVVAKKFSPQVACSNCRKIMESLADDPHNILIKHREYIMREGPSSLFTSTKFFAAYRHIANVIFFLIPKFITSYGIRKKIIDHLRTEVDIGYVFCAEHHEENTYLMYKVCTNVILFSYVSKVNRILCRRDFRHRDDDEVTRLAFSKFSTKRGY
uniref:THAP-type domain-containing protein n=1 Tax=Dendroctonus ponderosae TaxID=77166 RepID=A0AAR5Q909_DENPD